MTELKKRRKVEITPSPENKLDMLPELVYRMQFQPFFGDESLSSLAQTSRKQGILTEKKLGERKLDAAEKNLIRMANIYRILENQIQPGYAGAVSRDLVNNYLKLYFKYNYTDREILQNFVRLIKDYIFIFDNKIFLNNANKQDWNTALIVNKFDAHTASQTDVVKVITKLAKSITLSGQEKQDLLWRNYKRLLPTLIIEWKYSVQNSNEPYDTFVSIRNMTKEWTKEQKQETNKYLDELYKENRHRHITSGRIANRSQIGF